MDDYIGMTCEQVREGLSALLDNEASPVSRTAIDAHLAGCAGCVRWAEDAHAMTRRARLTAVGDVPDVANAVLGAWMAHPRVRTAKRWWRRGVAARIALAALAVAQTIVTFPQLWLGHDADTATHPAHELGSLGAAFAVGLAAAALRPARARGLVPIVGAGGLALTATAVADLLSGRTVISDELPHLIVVAGWVALMMLAAAERKLPGTPTLSAVRAAVAKWAIEPVPAEAPSAPVRLHPHDELEASAVPAARAAGAGQ